MNLENSPSPTKNTAAAEWAMVNAETCIKRWATQLSQFSDPAASKYDRDMAGRAVLIETDSFSEMGELMNSIADEAKLQFFCLDPAEIRETLADAISALPGHMPTMIYLVPGAWQGKNAQEDFANADEPASSEFRRQLSAFLLEKSHQLPIVFVTAAKSVSSLNRSLRNVGNFDRRIQMPTPSAESLANTFVMELSVEILGESLMKNAGKVGVLLQHEFADRRRRRLMQNAMRRLAWQENRKLEFTDLLNFAVHGTCEMDISCDVEQAKRRHCVHEAGHALMTHLDSREKSPPAYCSVVKRDGMHGIVVPAYDGHERISDDLSYRDIAHKIRGCLGGRAAEHLLLGAHEASASGSALDLEKATQLATSLFAHWGHSPKIATNMQAASNLATALEPTSASAAAHTEATVREFLQSQFLLTLDVLQKNKVYLEKIVAALMEKNVLFEDDFRSMVQVR